ncbi:alpha/beta hydrolase [Paenalcaligenes sp. Me131]|uniref:alpha/beta hydrolase n=1 Tax=Paenalcaligenes sp. Me131 TaxID=3392636 RepID=UPI003D286D03
MPVLRHLLLGIAAVSFSYALPTAAQPAQQNGRQIERVQAPSIADQELATYRFESFTLSSEDGKRHYKIEVGIPKRPAPATGFPVIYMLDGNAALTNIDTTDLTAMDALSPTVLVAIGYDINGSHDTTARAYDYTPPVFKDGVEQKEIEVRGRIGGGAAEFLELIETRIKPEVDLRAPTDHSRQTLWGHSYGGLFTLYTLFTRPELYQRYVAGDASLWWHDGFLVTDTFTHFDRSKALGKKIRLMEGGNRSKSRSASDSRAQWSAKDIVRDLQMDGVDISYENFSELHHGQMLRASLKPALRLAATPPQ